MLRWIGTLKFKIVALAVVTGVVSALATANLVLTATRNDIERVLLKNVANERESTAALLANKLDTLELAIKAVVRRARPELWRSRDDMQRFLQGNSAVNELFDSLVAAGPDGQMQVRLTRGQPADASANISDRAYFQNALKTDQPVLSSPVTGLITRTPLIVMAVSSRGPSGEIQGVIAASLELQSTRLFSDIGESGSRDGSRSMVMDRMGKLIVQSGPSRTHDDALQEPGLAGVFQRWRDSGSPIDSSGVAEISDRHVVSMAGIAGSDWTLVRVTPEDVALRPVLAAQRIAWVSALGVGLAAALLSGLVAWWLTRPISTLRERAERLLSNENMSAREWPSGSGELGQLSNAFREVVDQRQRRQAETQALLQQLEAVLEHAEVGIALSRSGVFELVSRHFCTIFRVERSAVEGQPTRFMYPSDEAYAALSERARPAFMGRGVFDGEVELVRGSGELFWAHMRGRAVAPGDRSRGTIWTIEDVTETRTHRERLAWSSSHDMLTGLTNRAAFEVLLEIATAQAAAEPFCAMFIDLDRFKQVNDTGGHAAGDALLRDVGHALSAQVRRSDTVARLGGDEFAVLLPRCPLSHAREVAEKLRSAVDAYRLEWDGHRFGVGTSIGLVAVDASFGTAADVLRAADAACYAAKQQGRNTVAVYGE